MSQHRLTIDSGPRFCVTSERRGQADNTDKKSHMKLPTPDSNLISVVSGPFKLKFGGEIDDTHVSILLEIHNDSFHDENASEKNEQKQTYHPGK